jgi:hypothetical protein
MLGEVSRIFDRNFAIGFFLPSAILLSLSAILLNVFIFKIDITTFQETTWLVLATVLGLLSLVGGIVLMAVNRDLYRCLEGYGAYNPLRLFGWFERKRFRDTLREYDELEEEYQRCLLDGRVFPLKFEQRQTGLAIRLADEFPDKEEYLLPTPFGNVLSSFESFPRVMYGLDSIPAWSRLLAVIPSEYMAILDGAKAHVDFWVNLGLVFILLQIEYAGVVFSTGGHLSWWVVCFITALGIIAPVRATSSALEWGAVVKSAFDVFIPRLREALEIEQPRNRDEEFDQWQMYSRASILRKPEYLPKMKRQKKSFLDILLGR